MITSAIAFTRVVYRKMSTISSVLDSLGVREMKTLDRDKFYRNMTVPILKVDERKLARIFAHIKKYLLKFDNFKPVQNDETLEDVVKIVFLHPDKFKGWSEFPDDVKLTLNSSGVTENNFESKEIEVKYENWRIDQIFEAVLPKNCSVSGYSEIGHIIHLNLRDNLLEYKSLIGQVFFDKVKRCETVVHKNNIINNTYRNFSMEVIAGKRDYFVKVKENQCTFEFDFSQVYWNPRLDTEHERILKQIKAEDVLFDVFCGVGPFTIPAVARRKARAYANDLNPNSVKWLEHSAKLNKIKNNLFVYNDDGANFIVNNFKNFLKDCCEGKDTVEGTIHVTMNLPAMAVEFLPYFVGILSDVDTTRLTCDIVVHVYCFSVSADPHNDAKEMVIANLKYDISDSVIQIFNVRNVSPKKEMMRVSFKMPLDVLKGNVDISEPPNKKCKSEAD